MILCGRAVPLTFCWNSVKIVSHDSRLGRDLVYVMEYARRIADPNKAPKVRFVSKLYHPNVYADGKYKKSLST